MWFEAQAAGIYAAHPGECTALQAQNAELFIADTPEEALAMTIAAHLDDKGCFTRLIPREVVGHQPMLCGHRNLGATS